MNLYDYLSNYDANIEDIFLGLYEKLKVINDNGLRISNLDSKHVTMNKDGLFDLSEEYELSDRGDNSNLITLTKMYLGAYYSKGREYDDLTKIRVDKLKDNLDDIYSTIEDDSFDKEYFDRVFDGELVYYPEYKTKKNESPKQKLLIRSDKQAYTVRALIVLFLSLSLGALLTVLMLLNR